MYKDIMFYFFLNQDQEDLNNLDKHLQMKHFSHTSVLYSIPHASVILTGDFKL